MVFEYIKTIAIFLASLATMSDLLFQLSIQGTF